MKKEKRVRNMDSYELIERDKDLLLRQAELFAELANKLSNEGSPITREDEQLLTIARIPLLDDAMASVKSMIIGGVHVDHIMEEVMSGLEAVGVNVRN